MFPEEGRNRVVVEGVQPAVDGGRFPIKRAVGEDVMVEADVFCDGHDALGCLLLHRHVNQKEWMETPMKSLGNDRWGASFRVAELGRYMYTVVAWVDHFRTWRHDLAKRVAAGQDVSVDMLIGAALIEGAAARADEGEGAVLSAWAGRIRAGAAQPETPQQALDEGLAAIALRYPDRSLATWADREYFVTADREKARYSAWYEIFPRSCAPMPGEHGTLADCLSRLPYIAAMGFDVVYLPPVHPIGETFRKGRNNATSAAPDDVGSPWAIGGAGGGHKSIEPRLGTMEDFLRLVEGAKEFGLEIAMDIAYQCTADHPYVKEHRSWFVERPDGSIQYAENPPKKYQDIYPLNFETSDWKGLWTELRDVVLFWIDKGVRIFRVDNPHTKAFAFWEWMIAEVQSRYPDVIFLSEAFTRPKVMYRLAKAGFTQSYTYFTWRNTRQELEEYFTWLDGTGVREFFRPNLWPNTPDILPEYLQLGGRPAFMVRLALAATLGASYGIYGPAFELCENTPRTPGGEEYLDSEKYEIRHRDLNSEWSLKSFIARINRIRKENEALHYDHGLHFHETGNPTLICYSKTAPDESNVVLVVANLDFRYTQSGWVELDLEALGLDEDQPYQAHDLLGGGRYLWQGSRNYVECNPHETPVHILLLRKKVRTERDFDYYL